MFEGKARRHETWWPLFFLIPFLLPVIVFWFVTIGTFWKVQRLYEEAFEEWFAGPATASDTVVVRAPAGSLGVFLARDASHRVTEVRASGPLAGRVAVGDRLVSISTPGRALFTCGPTATGPDIVDEIRAGSGSDGRVLTFARRGQGLLRELLPASCFDASPRRFFAIPVGIFVVALICFLVGGFFGGILLIFLSFPLAILSFGCCCCAIHCNPCAPTREDDIEARIRHLRAAAPRV